MEGVTCLATRLWFSQTSAPDFAMSPFLRVTQDYPWKRVPSTYAAEIFHGKGAVPYRFIPQLMGTNPSDLARIGENLLKNTDFVDINCGCPSPKVVGSHAGSGLLEKQDVFAKFLFGLQSEFGAGRFSVKMRSGFYSHLEFPELLSIVKEFPLKQLTLHARTRNERYLGFSRFELIQNAASVCSYPVVASGDITNYSSFVDKLNKAPSSQGFIVGRGALRNPWIFLELRNKTQVVISKRVLLYALACFAMMQELNQAEGENKLFDLLRDGVFLEFCGTNEQAWENLYCKLSFALFSHQLIFTELTVSKSSFARVKMIWNSLRSSLPALYMSPNLLRTTSVAQFLKELQAMGSNIDEQFCLVYNSSHDWIYSGARKNEQQQ